MKRFFAATFLLLLVITSCSEDRASTGTTSDTVLLRKIIEQDAEGNLLITSYEYDDTKLVAVSRNDSYREDFFYTGDQVTRVEYTSIDGEATWSTFEYDTEGRVSAMTEFGFDEIQGEEGEDPVQIPWANRTTYTYNADGTVSLAMFSGNHESQTEPAGVGTVITNNGNVTSYSSASGNSAYTFDANYNPRINTTGLAPLYVTWQSGGVNNITSATNSNGTASSSSTFTYNSDGYPISAVVETGGQTTEVWYLY